MVDTTVKKVNSKFSAHGEMEQIYLASGKSVSMRLWENKAPYEPKPIVEREYETVGYVIKGKAELYIEGQIILLDPGDSWVVPAGARHTYKVLETFTAVEATSPPAEIKGRDQASV